jgi:ribosomal protein L19E
MLDEKKKREEAQAKAASGEDQVEELTEEDFAKMKAEEEAKKSGAKPAEEEKKDEKAEGEEGENKGAKPNPGNGGTTDKYNWEQTLSEVTVNVDIPANIKGSHLDV